MEIIIRTAHQFKAKKASFSSFHYLAYVDSKSIFSYKITWWKSGHMKRKILYFSRLDSSFISLHYYSGVSGFIIGCLCTLFRLNECLLATSSNSLERSWQVEQMAKCTDSQLFSGEQELKITNSDVCLLVPIVSEKTDHKLTLTVLYDDLA